MIGRRIVTPEGVREGAIRIEEGRITAFGALNEVPRDGEVLDAGDLHILPGLVDTHVHVNEPGREEWEGFESATRAAAAGGVTTMLDMPLNSIPATTDVAALDAKREAARGRCSVDVGFIGGVVPGNADDLEPLAGAGVLAFKCFLAPSGVKEFEHVGQADLREAMRRLATIDAVLMVHAELPQRIDAATREIGGSDARRYATYLATRPAAAETDAVALVIDAAERSGGRAHIVHLSASESVPLLRDARARGVRISAETCPHYLTFSAEEIEDGATQFKCAPPVRAAPHREALWEALRRGDIEMIVSDHSPCTPELKGREAGDFVAAWGGIASLQLGLLAVWSGMRSRGMPIHEVARWMSEAPARLVGLGAAKGRISPGFDADLVLFDADDESTVDSERLLHRHPVTPYAGRQLKGAVEATYLRGELAYSREGGPVRPARGALLSRDSRGTASRTSIA